MSDRRKHLEFLRKTARLVQEHTDSGFIHEPGRVYELNADALAAIANEPKPISSRTA